MRARRLRRLLRSRWQRNQAPSLPAAPPDDPIVSGSTVLFPGEHHRQDFAYLIALRRNRNIRLLFLFYDLLHVLDDDDPRLQDPLAADLPQTDFMVREASLLLAISQFSASELRRHLARRGVLGPPIATIRLAGEIPSSAQPATAVRGLATREFVLTVGDVVHRKNHVLLVDVWRSWIERGEPPSLVIVGRIDEEGEDLIQSVLRDPMLRRRILFLANIDDSALVWLYPELPLHGLSVTAGRLRVAGCRKPRLRQGLRRIDRRIDPGSRPGRRDRTDPGPSQRVAGDGAPALE